MSAFIVRFRHGDGVIHSPPPKLLRIAAATGIALAAIPSAAAAGVPIATADECAHTASQADEVICLRRALEESQAALAGRRGRHAAKAAAARTEPPAPAVRAAGASEQLGAEQVAVERHVPVKQPRDTERVRATVQASETDRRGIFTVRLDNGQVWRQAEDPSIPIVLDESKPYPVEIARSGFGGYRMLFTAMRREIVVKRIQ